MARTHKHKHTHYDVDALKDAAAGRWPDILISLGHCPAGSLDGAHHPCPRCGGHDRFRLIDREAGALYCNQCFASGNGDGIAALGWLRGWQFAETLTHLAEHLGVAPSLNGHAPKSKADPEANLVWRNWSDNLALFFCRGKPGVNVESLVCHDARLGRYRERHNIVGLPIREPDAKIVGWCIWEQSGKTLPAFHGPGKPPTHEKMLTTAGSKAGLIATAETLTQLREPAQSRGSVLWKVEGPTDALALYTAIPIEVRDREMVIANTGGSRQNVSIDWLPLFAGREVVIVHDADEPGELGAAKWVKALVGLPGTTVRHVRLPYTVEKSHGKDLRDWLNEGHTFAELAELAQNTPPIAADSLPPLAPIESEDDPHRLARLWLAQQPGPIKYWRCDYYRWNGRCYEKLADEQMLSELAACIKAEFDRLNLLDQEDGATGEDGGAKQCRHVTGAKIGNTRLATNALTIVASHAEPPSYQSEWRQPMPGKHCISLANGILDLDALLSGADLADVLLPHTPAFFTLNSLPFPFDPDSECPRWLSVLGTNQEGDVERLAILQEWAGYLLTPDTSEQKFLICEGEGNNGKSVYLAGIEAMLGLENVSHVPLEHFAHRFALTSTLHKLANIAADCGDLDKVAEGFLKSFTSGDRMMFDRKNKPAIEATPTARLMLATNNRPRFSDRSGGLWRRMILVPWRHDVPASERIKGMDKPAYWLASGELPGILNWAVAGLARLCEQGGFTRSRLVDEGVESYRTEVNPTRQFLIDNVKEAAECHVTCKQLYIYYAEWCKEFGYHKTNEVNFGKEVFRRFPGVTRTRKTIGAERPWAYEGIFYSADSTF